ncbi:MAG: threo-3-hydroxy-L-aspartate ammonia-lyase [Burkholderiaceae bacterium]
MTKLMKSDSLPVSFSNVQAAARRLAGVAHRTPVLTSRTANQLTGAQLFFKAENLQRIGAFKFRGAYNALAVLDEAKRRQGVLAYSSGNHAQAVALAASLLGIAATIVMPEDAPASKLAATRGYGAQVVLYNRYEQDRAELAQALAAERSLTVIPPYDHVDVIAGQGTAALELLEDTGPLDALVVCVGGGGLISGCALAAHGLAPNCEVIGIEPAAGNDAQQSMARGEIVRIDVPHTIADGAQTQFVGGLTFPIMQALVSRIDVVSDDELIQTMRWFAERMKIVVEPTGCLASAAVLQDKLDLRGKRVGIIISGGNVDVSRYAQLLAG